ncbi:MAG: dCTP deaminase [Chloroflexi bacterium]|nr:dCTP deaminase [Chloroflexota bacterium]
MVLSDTEIRAALDDNRLKIDPYPGERIGPSSVDLLLHPSLRILPSPDEVRGVSIDPREVQVANLISQQPEHRLDRDGPCKMRHGQVIIGKTLETIALPVDLAGRIEGKSSLARLGLAVHITAPTIQAGFRGSLVLEMYNAGPWTLELTEGMQIAQVIFEQMGSRPSQGYQGQFQDQR